MYKVLYFLLVASTTICMFTGGTQGSPLIGLLGLLGGFVLTLVWGIWTKAGGGRIFLTALLSLIPLLGPWIAYAMLVKRTPSYAGSLSYLFTWSALLKLLAALFGLVLVGGAVANLFRPDATELELMLIPALIGLNLAVFFGASLFQAGWVRAGVVVPVLVLQIGLLVPLVAVQLNLPPLLSLLLGLGGVAAAAFCLAYLLKAKWASPRTLLPFIFITGGLLISVYGWFGTGESRLMLAAGIGGIVTAAAGLGLATNRGQKIGHSIGMVIGGLLGGLVLIGLVVAFILNRIIWPVQQRLSPTRIELVNPGSDLVHVMDSSYEEASVPVGTSCELRSLEQEHIEATVLIVGPIGVGRRVINDYYYRAYCQDGTYLIQSGDFRVVESRFWPTAMPYPGP